MEKDLIANAKKIVETAKSEGIILRLLGALAVRLHCLSANEPALRRPLSDIDLMGYSKQRGKIEKLLNRMGYIPNVDFNRLHGHRRLIFQAPFNATLDIFFDKFEMCHTFDFRKRLHIDEYTLSPADLLMTKLQIVELNEKDVKDILCLLKDHEFGYTDTESEQINIRYMSDMCRDDWGKYKTFTMNIQKILKVTDKLGLDSALKRKLHQLLDSIQGAKKTLRWKCRAIIGEKKRWYEQPSFRRSAL